MHDIINISINNIWQQIICHDFEYFTHGILILIIKVMIF
jgi:hypothetical protein